MQFSDFNVSLISSGYEIPLLGFGVAFGFGKREDTAAITKPSLLEALIVGYRCVTYRDSVDQTYMTRNGLGMLIRLRCTTMRRRRATLFAKVAFLEMNCSLVSIRTGLERDYTDLFLASKVPDYEGTYEKASACLDRSLKDLGVGTFEYYPIVSSITLRLFTGYLDMYLIHKAPQGTEARIQTWKALIDAKEAGKVRTIGVSN